MGHNGWLRNGSEMPGRPKRRALLVRIASYLSIAAVRAMRRSLRRGRGRGGRRAAAADRTPLAARRRRSGARGGTGGGGPPRPEHGDAHSLVAPSAPGLRSPQPHLHRDCTQPCHFCTGLRSPLPLGSPCHICAGTALTPATSVHICTHRDRAHSCHVCTGLAAPGGKPQRPHFQAASRLDVIGSLGSDASCRIAGGEGCAGHQARGASEVARRRQLRGPRRRGEAWAAGHRGGDRRRLCLPRLGRRARARMRARTSRCGAAFARCRRLRDGVAWRVPYAARCVFLCCP
jgi:hypothetical protein